MKAIRCRYLSPTATRGARIVAEDGDGNRCTIPYNFHELGEGDQKTRAALVLCAKMGWEGDLIRGELWNDDVFVFCEEAGSERIHNPTKRLAASPDTQEVKP